MRHPRLRAALAAAAASLVLAPVLAAPASAAPSEGSNRIYGADRIGTAVAVSHSRFDDDGSYAVFVASAADWPDALAASALAAQYDAPLLLVAPTGDLAPAVTTELDRLDPEEVFVLGGQRSVSGAVEAQLAAHGKVTRFNGTDRYDTAAYAASVLADPGKPLYVASGAGFADALGGGAAAGAAGGALVLSEPGRLSESLAKDLPGLAPSSVVVMGGPAVVSDTVLEAVRRTLPGVPVTRTAGADRYATAAAASAQVHPAGSLAGEAGPGVVLLASGTSFPDGLAGAAASGPSGAPLLLTTKDCVPTATLAEMDRLGASGAVVLGGPGVVSDAAAALTPC